MSTPVSILFPDNLHFHERNFRSLVEYVAREKIRCHFVDERRDWLSLFGDYDSKRPLLGSYSALLARLDPDDLFHFEHRHVPVFDCLRAEILAYALPRLGWYLDSVPADDRSIFERLRQGAPELLRLNYAATINWLDFWADQLARLPKFSHCCVFSGSPIYTRTLLALLKTTQTSAIVLESAFTGNEYYFEERYSPIANATDIRHPSVFDAIPVPADPNEWDRDRLKAINKLLGMRNKNVAQPARRMETLPFSRKAPVLTVLGQVLNDFSIIERRHGDLSSVHFYRTLIKEVLANSGYNIVFKAHPWERQKVHVRAPLTLQAIEGFVASLPDARQRRVLVTENFNLQNLLEQSDQVLVLNSQSALEAAFHGLKPAQFGRAFYAQRGFTSDFDGIEAIPAFVGALAKDRVRGRLSLDEYDQFETFLVKFLLHHLVCVHPSGIPVLEKRLSPPPTIALHHAGPSDSSAEQQEPASVPQSMPSRQVQCRTPPKHPTPEIRQQPQRPLWGRKLRKLQRNPGAFLGDSQNRSLRTLGRMLSTLKGI